MFSVGRSLFRELVRTYILQKESTLKCVFSSDYSFQSFLVHSSMKSKKTCMGSLSRATYIHIGGLMPRSIHVHKGTSYILDTCRLRKIPARPQNFIAEVVTMRKRPR
jgi:hypothetical protein